MQQVALALLSWAALVMGVPNPGTLPVIEPVPRTYLREFFCEQRCEMFAVFAPVDQARWDGEWRIYIGSHLDFEDLYARSILVHELIHYLQHLQFPYDGQCAEAMRRERQAYYLQSEYLIRHGSMMGINMSATPLTLTCKES